jgi:hypothetical protein
MRLNPYLVRPGLPLVTGATGDGGEDTESEGNSQAEDIEAGPAITKAASTPAASTPAAITPTAITPVNGENGENGETKPSDPMPDIEADIEAGAASAISSLAVTCEVFKKDYRIIEYWKPLAVTFAIGEVIVEQLFADRAANQSRYLSVIDLKFALKNAKIQSHTASKDKLIKYLGVPRSQVTLNVINDLSSQCTERIFNCGNFPATTVAIFNTNLSNNDELTRFRNFLSNNTRIRRIQGNHRKN